MSLTITILESPPGQGKSPKEIGLLSGADLAGPESWRREVYGSVEARDSGLTILTSLVDGNLVLSGAQLPATVKEIEVIDSSIPRIAARLAVREEMIKERFLNIRNACVQAAEKGYCVWIS